MGPPLWPRVVILALLVAAVILGSLILVVNQPFERVTKFSQVSVTCSSPCPGLQPPPYSEDVLVGRATDRYVVISIGVLVVAFVVLQAVRLGRRRDTSRVVRAG